MEIDFLLECLKIDSEDSVKAVLSWLVYYSKYVFKWPFGSQKRTMKYPLQRRERTLYFYWEELTLQYTDQL